MQGNKLLSPYDILHQYSNKFYYYANCIAIQYISLWEQQYKAQKPLKLTSSTSSSSIQEVNTLTNIMHNTGKRKAVK